MVKLICFSLIFFALGCTNLKFKAEHCFKPNDSTDYKCNIVATFESSDVCEHFKLTYQSLIDFEELKNKKVTTITLQENSSFGDSSISCKN